MDRLFEKTVPSELRMMPAVAADPKHSTARAEGVHLAELAEGPWMDAGRGVAILRENERLPEAMR